MNPSCDAAPSILLEMKFLADYASMKEPPPSSSPLPGGAFSQERALLPNVEVASSPFGESAGFRALRLATQTPENDWCFAGCLPMKRLYLHS